MYRIHTYYFKIVHILTYFWAENMKAKRGHILYVFCMQLYVFVRANVPIRLKYVPKYVPIHTIYIREHSATYMYIYGQY